MKSNTVSLRKFLIEKGFHRIPLNLTKTNHFETKAIFNGIEGSFIIDTGASNSCVGFEAVSKFHLSVEDSEIKAAGAGASDMFTKLSKSNKLELGTWSRKRTPLVLFDLSHVNSALIAHQASPVDGIIGADILKKGKAIIDYDRKCLYLK